MSVHPTAIVGGGAEIDPTCDIGPYAVIGPKVKLGPRTWVGPHAVVEGRTSIGAGARIFQFASVGAIPQDLKYAGEDTALVIGDRTTVREFATVHLGTAGGGGVTRVGAGCLLMAYSHVAHDCVVGDGVVLANCASLAGHVTVEDHVIFGGISGVHQFTRIGRHAFISGGSMVGQDVPPYCTATGNRAELAGLNTVGLKRHGFTDEQIARVKSAYKIVFRSALQLREALARVRAEYGGNPEIDHFVAFIEGSERGITR